MSANKRANAVGSASKITQKKRAKKVSNQVKKTPAKSTKPHPSASPRVSMPAAELAKQVKLFKAMTQPIDFDGMAHLPTQDANNLAHFHQRTTNVFSPNSDGTLKFVMTNWPDARVLAQLDTPPESLVSLVQSENFEYKAPKRGQFAYRIYPEQMRWWRNFKRDFWEHAHDSAWRAHMVAVKHKFSRHYLTPNGHRVALPGPMLSQPTCTYLTPELVPSGVVGDSWWYNSGAQINGKITNGDEKPLNGLFINMNGETEVRAINSDHHGSTQFKLVKPFTATAPVPFTGPQVPIVISFPKGSIPDPLQGNMQISSATGKATVKLYAAEDYYEITGNIVAKGSLVASTILLTVGGAFALNWAPGCTPAGGQSTTFVCSVAASIADVWIKNLSITVPQMNYTPDPDPMGNWYALSTIDSEQIIDSTQSLRTIGSEAEISSFSPLINTGGQITQCLLPADFFNTYTLNDITDSLLNQIPDRRNAAVVEGGRSFLPPFAGQQIFTSEDDVDNMDENALEQPTIAFVLSGMDSTASMRLQTGLSLEGPSVSQLFVNRAYPPDIAAQQRVTGAISVMPHHNGNPLGALALAVAEGAFIAACKRFPLMEEMAAFVAYFKKLYDTKYASESTKVSR